MQCSASGFSFESCKSCALLIVLTISGAICAPIAISADRNAAVPDALNAQEKATISPSDPPLNDVKTASSPEISQPKSSQNGRGVPQQDISTPPKTERQLAEERKARDAARKRGEITFDDLKFDIERGGEYKPEMLTPAIKELEKKIVKLRGFILPNSVFQTNGIKQFVLVRDNRECCFGPGAAIYDCVWVEMAAGKTATFSTQVITVKGKLEIDAETFKNTDGYAIFKMTAEEVK